MSRLAVLPQLRPESYQRHPLQSDSVAWPEKNCYADLWVGFVHALGLDPQAMLGFTASMDFEGDQWTFFKPPSSDLRRLYGIDVQELTVYKPLLAHAQEHLGAGRLVSTEADAWWLPDTAGTDYRGQHTKTTILLADLDVSAQRLGYFHNAGYFELQGEDFRGLFRLDAPADPAFMPLFAETVRIDRLERASPAELSSIAWDLLREHVAWRPRSNPFTRFAERLGHELPQLQQAGLAHYHLWAFATVRQAGAAFELLAAHLRWQAGQGRAGLDEAADGFDAIAQAGKALILKGARAVSTGRALAADDLLQGMADHWEQGMGRLQAALHAR
ncbi:DUF1839 family protein [Ramlibacter sp. AW1]|uniref:DUF1839 family protein n=1 Tax=Ramlibacter aurantiacus TaxID=2801330 RepID=A0A936ZL79_9BURK|nr:DUF1839 family protein [Ramlibacter aurantiacus]MBL0419343.1 DUF1839 family protein [Ramlibacter aurantiacus]